MTIPLSEGAPPLGARLREARELRGLSQREAAEIVGVTQVTWSRWETGRSGVQRRCRRDVAAFLEVGNHDFADLVDERSVRPTIVPIRGVADDVARQPRSSNQPQQPTIEQRETLAAILCCMGSGRKLESYEVEWFRELVRIVGLR
jgi:transcriptional regulator with XRE-family HTH domain